MTVQAEPTRSGAKIEWTDLYSCRYPARDATFAAVALVSGGRAIQAVLTLSLATCGTPASLGNPTRR